MKALIKEIKIALAIYNTKREIKKAAKYNAQLKKVNQRLIQIIKDGNNNV